MILIASIAVAVAIGRILLPVFFDSLSDLLECVRLCCTPDFVDLLFGEWHDDQWAKLKVFVYLALSVGSGVMTNYSLHRLF